jgi:enterochelin esterase-like enzyme
MSRLATILLGFAICAGGCHQRFESVQMHSRTEDRQLRYGVYLPPQWDEATPLPVVVLLHGAGDDAESADRRVVTRRLDAAVIAGDVPPFIMVTPEGERGFWMNWHDGSHHWRDWVLEEVVPAVREAYPTIEGPQGLHLMGVSMGGGGGMQMWLDDPSRFASATIVSAPILDEADTRAFLRRFVPPQALQAVFGPPGSNVGTDPYAALTDPAALEGSRLLFGAAEHDRGGILESNRAFHRHLKSHGVPHRFVVFKGGHGWRAWARVFPYALCIHLDPSCTLPPPPS